MKEHLVRVSLKRSIGHLPESAHDTIVAGLKRDGVIEDESHDSVIRAADSGSHHITTLRAAAQDRTKSHLARQAIQMIAHTGIRVDTEIPLDAADLSSRMRDAGVSLDDRWRIKNALSQIGCL